MISVVIGILGGTKLQLRITQPRGPYILSGLFMGSPFLETKTMKGNQNPCFNNKIMLIIKIWTIRLG